MDHKLSQLAAMTQVVADTGDLDAIATFKPQDATTNPSLMLKAAQSASTAHLFEAALHKGKSLPVTGQSQVNAIVDEFAVRTGCEILNIVPGYVSTEVDARLSFNTQATINKARVLIDLYQQQGIERDRVLIKIAATWEGIQAARILEQEGIHCNLTLLFAFAQAQACANAKVTLISPFVGRIMDWYCAHTGTDHYAPLEDPGVQSVTRIYHYYKTHHIDTIVMGASFRNQGQIEALAGCDRLTISPDLMQKLSDDTSNLPRQLDSAHSAAASSERFFDMSETEFRWQMNEDAMATEKLAEGIRKFAQDQEKLEALVRERLK